MREFLKENIQWIFSGIGVLIITMIIAAIRFIVSPKRKGAMEPSEQEKIRRQPEPKAEPTNEENKAKTQLPAESKEKIAAVIRYWPFLALGIALYNYGFETLGPKLKGEFVFVSFLYAFSRYLLLVSIARRRISVWYRRLHMATRLVAIAIIIPLMFQYLNQLYHSSRELGNFEYRIDNILEHQYRTYNSYMLPGWLYEFLKKSMGRPYYPQLYDQIRRYDFINVYAYHLGKVGIIGYEYKGRFYPAADSTEPFCCINYGEMPVRNPVRHVICRALPDSQEIRPNRLEQLSNFKGSSIFASYDVSRDFHFVRFFCGPGSMTPGQGKNEYEAFVFDFRNLAHPPPMINVFLVTDRQIYNVNIYGLHRRRTLVDRLLARPFYAQDESTLVTELGKDVPGAMIDSIAASLDRNGHVWGAKNLAVYRYGLETCGERQIFLLRYRVKGSIL